jgi:hypothetical protein
LDDQVLVKIACLLMRWLFSLAVLVCSGDREKNAELLVLRHENAVLRRNAGRVQYEPGRPGLVRRVHPVHPAPALGRGLPGHTRDTAGLAPQARRQEIRNERTTPPRPPR